MSVIWRLPEMQSKQRRICILTKSKGLQAHRVEETLSWTVRGEPELEPHIKVTRKRAPRRAERAGSLRGTGPKRKQVRQSVPGSERGSRKSEETWVKPGLELELKAQGGPKPIMEHQIRVSWSWLWAQKGFRGRHPWNSSLAQFSAVA